MFTVWTGSFKQSMKCLFIGSSGLSIWRGQLWEPLKLEIGDSQLLLYIHYANLGMKEGQDYLSKFYKITLNPTTNHAAFKYDLLKQPGGQSVICTYIPYSSHKQVRVYKDKLWTAFNDKTYSLLLVFLVQCSHENMKSIVCRHL